MKNLVDKYLETDKFRNGLGIPKEAKISCELLAQGEYNQNYLFVHPVSEKKLLLRLNMGSQMHLENQIEYEYQALKQLETSERTPKVYYVDGSKEVIPHGVLVMEYLPGRVMDYLTDMHVGAEILADIHSISVDAEGSLIHSQNPCKEILEECNQMFRVYEESELADEQKKKQIRRMLDICEEKIASMGAYTGYKCCINTELNSTNFLVNETGSSYLIDWEKPLYGDPGQDLGHFLAPTTTFWKTDVILSEEETEAFLNDYIACVDNRYDLSDLKERVAVFIPVTCMRGMTWCAMAWIEYQQPGRAIRNESTWKKLNAYLEQSFINMIEKRIEKM